jgi:Alpha/beta hydrolase domain
VYRTINISTHGARPVGNAKGGVRTTYLDVPIYTYTIPNSDPGLCNQTGYQTPLPDDVLRSLYKNRSQYVSKVNYRLMELIREDWSLNSMPTTMSEPTLKPRTFPIPVTKAGIDPGAGYSLVE